MSHTDLAGFPLAPGSSASERLGAWSESLGARPPLNQQQVDGRWNIETGGIRWEREILVALQPFRFHRETWDALATQIEAAPPNWRWWLRRHPVEMRIRGYRRPDHRYGRLLELDRPKVIFLGNEVQWHVPLQRMIQHMDVLVSQYSSAALEAVDLGVPAIFLSERACTEFPDVITQGRASIVNVADINVEIAHLPVSALNIRSGVQNENPHRSFPAKGSL